ncbi:MAG: HDIG domain-containing protein [Calditrichia bacterium]|nr:HDIG domain-containing protein [Calditrichia bacterium]
MSIKNKFNFFANLNNWLDKTINIKRTSTGVEDDNGSIYKDLGIKLFLFISLLVFLSFLFPSGISFQYANLKTGMIAPEKIEAPFTFPILKTEEELKEERNHVMRSVEGIFKKDSLAYEIEIIKFANLLHEFTQLYKKDMDLQNVVLEADTISENYKTQMDSIIYDWKIKYGLILNRRNLKTMYKLEQDKKLNAFQFKIDQFFKDVYEKGIINIPRYNLLSENILVISGKKEEVLKKEQYYPLSDAVASIKRRGSEIFKDADVITMLIPIVEAFCKPNLYYQPDLTKTKQEEAIQGVALSKGFIYEEQLIIDKGEIVTPELYNTLHSLSLAQAEKGLLLANKREWLFKIGIYIVSALLLGIFCLYIYIYRSHTFKNNQMLFLIYLIFILQFGINFLFVKVLDFSPLTMPIILLPMMLTMLVDSRTAFTGVFVAAFFTAAIVGMDIYYAFYTITTGVAVIFSTRRLRRRADSIKAVITVFLVYAITYLSLGFLRFAAFTDLIQELMLPLVSTVAFMFIFYMVIPVFEKMFDLVTDITLLELSNLNSPLLKRLSVEAPGTFHHSLIMGNLAEAAAEKIDANPLLARVGCYYHDIGKMERPEYFVENQMGAMNRHESLQPNMSALILENHVKIGLKLAEKYKIPSVVKQFIPEHHGTTRMEYFYHKAKEMAEDKELDDREFRYPGPKPRSQETAIAMLADGIEAAARSLKNPSPGKIRQLVSELVNKKFADGELENCNLTLHNLHLIKEALVPLLIGIHHSRVEYPKEGKIDGKESQNEKPDLDENEIKNLENQIQEEKLNEKIKIKESKNIKSLNKEKE